MKGYRTYVVGFLLATVPPGLTYLAGLDWGHIVGPNGAALISAIIMVAMRTITNTPPTQG